MGAQAQSAMSGRVRRESRRIKKGSAGANGEEPAQLSTRLTTAGCGLRCISVTAIVHTPEEAKSLEQPPLLVLRPLEAFLDEHGLGQGDITAQPVGDGHSNVTYLISPTWRSLGAATPAAAAASALRARCPARGVAAPRVAADHGARAHGAGHVRRRQRDRCAVLRDGARGGHGRQRRAAGRRHARADRRGADRRARRGARHRLAGVRAGGLRQADGLPRTPGPPLHRLVGAQRHARDRRARRGHRLARRAHPGVGPGHDRPRRLPPRERDVHLRPAERDLRLGARDDRGSPGRRGLPARDLGTRGGSGEHDRLFDHCHTTARLPHPRRPRGPLRGPLRTVHARPALVHHAGPVEVRDLPGREL